MSDACFVPSISCGISAHNVDFAEYLRCGGLAMPQLADGLKLIRERLTQGQSPPDRMAVPPMNSDLDLAYGRATSGTDADHLRFYRVLADATLFLLLDREAEGEVVAPRVFDLPDGPVLLAFDSEERLASFGDGPLPYAALPGRIVAQQMVGQGLSLGLNLGTGAESETLLPPEAMEWLTEMLAGSPDAVQAKVARFLPPQGLPTALTEALESAMIAAAGLAQVGVLAAVRYQDGRLGHMLALVGAQPAAEPALARAMAEALTFSGVEAGELDVTFLAAEDPGLAAILRVAQVFAIPELTVAAQPLPKVPGADPSKPPILR